MKRGIDVSYHNGVIDWNKVKKSGIEFAMIRTGYGISSPNQVDKKFHENIEGAINAGIDVGVYHYSYAISPLDASREASFCLDIIKDYKLTYPVAYDIEDPSIAKYTKQEKTDMCKSFCDKIEMNGYYAMIYCNKNWINNHLHAHEILPYYDLWLAQWGADKPDVACGIWQKSDSGKIDGINGSVDINVSFKDYREIIKSKGLNKWDIKEDDSQKENTTNENATQEIEYVVKEGDSLWAISEKYYGTGTNWGLILQHNNLATSTIYPGQILKIPKQ